MLQGDTLRVQAQGLHLMGGYEMCVGDSRASSCLLPTLLLTLPSHPPTRCAYLLLCGPWLLSLTWIRVLQPLRLGMSIFQLILDGTHP